MNTEKTDSTPEQKNMEKATEEIQEVLRRRKLAGLVLLTDGASGRVTKPLMAPWNSVRYDHMGKIVIRMDDETLLGGTFRMFEVLTRMCGHVLNEMRTNAEALVAQNPDLQLTVAESPDARTIGETSQGVAAATPYPDNGPVQRCRVCGTDHPATGWYHERLCTLCFNKG